MSVAAVAALQTVSMQVKENYPDLLPRNYVKYAAVCLEAQRHANAENLEGKGNVISRLLQPGETYQQTTMYKFTMYEASPVR